MLRAEKGASLQQVADAVGVSKAHIWELETGKKKVKPSLDLVQRLADHFGVTVAFFVDEDPKAEKREDPAVVLYRDFKILNEQDQLTIKELVRSMKNRSKKGIIKNKGREVLG